MVISHNLSAMYSNRQLGIVDNKSAKSTERLSSGYRINRSADDASGLAISEKMRRQIRGLQQGAHNAQDGISMVQVADGAMNEIQDMLHRGNELSIKAANGTLSYDDRCNIQAELDHLVTEIDSISTRTKFNEIKVLKSTYISSGPSEIVIQGKLPSWVKAGSSLGTGYMSETYTTHEIYEEYDSTQTKMFDDVIPIKHSASTIDFSGFQGSDAQKKELYGTGFYFTCCTCSNHYSVKFTNDATNSLKTSGDHFIYNVGVKNINNADDLLDAIIKATEGGNPNRHFTYLDVDKVKGELIIYDGRYMDPADKPALSNPAYGVSWPNWKYCYDYARAGPAWGLFGEGVAYDSSDIIEEGSADITLQVGAEVGDRITISLASISKELLQISSLDVRTQEGARDAMDAFEYANQYVSKERARMGAYQNRLEHTIKNLDNVIENTTMSESAIRDTDMAKEMVEYSNQNILKQSVEAMLAQANKEKEGILQLLQ